MKQLLVLSGKGGTGKTTVAASLIDLLDVQAFADCDVDAPNLHLVVGVDGPHRLRPHFGLPKAQIDPHLCRSCDRCLPECRFEAISVVDEVYTIDPFACEGCGLCQELCPADAISSVPTQTGTLALASDTQRVFSTAVLAMGQGNSGQLVWSVKKQLAEAVSEQPPPLAIIDGSPGIGCPVMSSLSGIDLLLVVAEPSVAGLSDLKRLLEVAIGMEVPVAVCVNKADVNPEKAEEVEALCDSWGIPLIGRIPFDPAVPAAINAGRTLASDPGPAGEAIREIGEAIGRLLELNPADTSEGAPQRGQST